MDTAQMNDVLHFLGDTGIKLDKADDIRGKMLHDVSGKPIGKIHEFVLNHEGDHIVYMEVESGSLFARQRFLVPVSEVTRHSDQHFYLKSSGECTDETPWNCPELHVDHHAAAPPT